MTTDTDTNGRADHGARVVAMVRAAGAELRAGDRAVVAAAERITRSAATDTDGGR